MSTSSYDAAVNCYSYLPPPALLSSPASSFSSPSTSSSGSAFPLSSSGGLSPLIPGLDESGMSPRPRLSHEDLPTVPVPVDDIRQLVERSFRAQAARSAKTKSKDAQTRLHGFGTLFPDAVDTTANNFNLGVSTAVVFSLAESTRLSKAGSLSSMSPPIMFGGSSCSNRFLFEHDLKLYGKICSVVAGVGHVVALTDTGHVFSFGQGQAGQLGLGPDTKVVKEQLTLVPLQHVFTSSERKLEQDRMENSSSNNNSAPGKNMLLPDYPPIAYIAAGEFCTSAITFDGQLIQWGDGVFEPTLHRGALSGKVVRQIAHGQSHTVALVFENDLGRNKKIHTVWTWGTSNDQGQLARGPRGRYDPVPARTSFDLQPSSVFAIKNFSGLVSESGDVWVWGRLGRDKEARAMLAPRKVTGLSDILQVSCTSEYLQAMCCNGTLKVWYPARDESNDILLSGATLNEHASGLDHWIARSADSQVWTQGRAREGQLIGATRDYSTPILVSTFSGTDVHPWHVAAGPTSSFVLLGTVPLPVDNTPLPMSLATSFSSSSTSTSTSSSSSSSSSSSTSSSPPGPLNCSTDGTTTTTSNQQAQHRYCRRELRPYERWCANCMLYIWQQEAFACTECEIVLHPTCSAHAPFLPCGSGHRHTTAITRAPNSPALISTVVVVADDADFDLNCQLSTRERYRRIAVAKAISNGFVRHLPSAGWGTVRAITRALGWANQRPDGSPVVIESPSGNTKVVVTGSVNALRDQLLTPALKEKLDEILDYVRQKIKAEEDKPEGKRHEAFLAFVRSLPALYDTLRRDCLDFLISRPESRNPYPTKVTVYLDTTVNPHAKAACSEEDRQRARREACELLDQREFETRPSSAAIGDSCEAVKVALSTPRKDNIRIGIVTALVRRTSELRREFASALLDHLITKQDVARQNEDDDVAAQDDAASEITTLIRTSMSKLIEHLQDSPATVALARNVFSELEQSTVSIVRQKQEKVKLLLHAEKKKKALPAEFLAQGEDCQDIWIPPDDVVISTKLLGKGAYASVFHGAYRRQKVAVKVMSHEVKPEDVADFNREIKLLRDLRSPRNVHIWGVTMKPHLGNPNALMCVLELCDSGSLTSFLKDTSRRFFWSEFFLFAENIITGVNTLHGWVPPVVHRDLKTDNILVDSNGIKLADFGKAMYTAKESETPDGMDTWMMSETIAVDLRKLEGTPIYLAPEMAKVSSVVYGPKQDIYSLAFIIWELLLRCLSGRYHRPGAADNLSGPQAIYKSMEGWRESFPSRTPACLRNLVQRCWDADPNRRPDCSSLLDLIEHAESEYIQNQRDWDGRIHDASKTSLDEAGSDVDSDIEFDDDGDDAPYVIGADDIVPHGDHPAVGAIMPAVFTGESNVLSTVVTVASSSGSASGLGNNHNRTPKRDDEQFPSDDDSNVGDSDFSDDEEVELAVVDATPVSSNSDFSSEDIRYVASGAIPTPSPSDNDKPAPSPAPSPAPVTVPKEQHEFSDSDFSDVASPRSKPGAPENSDDFGSSDFDDDHKDDELVPVEVHCARSPSPPSLQPTPEPVPAPLPTPVVDVPAEPSAAPATEHSDSDFSNSDVDAVNDELVSVDAAVINSDVDSIEDELAPVDAAVINSDVDEFVPVDAAVINSDVDSIEDELVPVDAVAVVDATDISQQVPSALPHEQPPREEEEPAAGAPQPDDQAGRSTFEERFHMGVSYNSLLRPEVRSALNPAMLECHLKDAQFESVFQMSRERFAALPAWRQKELKRKVQLF